MMMAGPVRKASSIDYIAMGYDDEVWGAVKDMAEERQKGVRSRQIL